MNLATLPHPEQVAAILTASPEAIRTAWQKHQSAKGHAARKLKGPRCPCGANTLKRAETRRFECCKKAGAAYTGI